MGWGHGCTVGRGVMSGILCVRPRSVAAGRGLALLYPANGVPTALQTGYGRQGRFDAAKQA